ncbi:MAG: hypothetical protein U5L95_05515 [Candidatus Saccharibacteria bacterium]|nr:hypothetical protein [Candidatus Saccharibacteria bacterium]
MFRGLAKSVKGDTIVEVLMAIVVVSSTLGAAFATMDRGTAGTRASQERAEALKHVETQVEMLKTAISNNVVSTPLPPDPFCLYISTSNDIQVAELPGLANGDLEDSEDFSHYDTLADPPPGNPCRKGSIPGNYNVSIIHDGSDTFTARAHWDNVGGNQRDRIEIKYWASL